MTVDSRDVPCRGCGNLSLKHPAHIYRKRKCCPDCDHRPTDTWPIRAGLIEVLQRHGLGPMALKIADELIPVVGQAIQAEADELREVALLSDGSGWNPHRVWTWLSDRATRDTLRSVR